MTTATGGHLDQVDLGATSPVGQTLTEAIPVEISSA
jgi:hypothetical protein